MPRVLQLATMIFIYFAALRPVSCQILPPTFRPLPTTRITQLQDSVARLERVITDVRTAAENLRSTATKAQTEGPTAAAIRLRADADTLDTLAVAEESRAQAAEIAGAGATQLRDLLSAQIGNAEVRIQALELELTQLNDPATIQTEETSRRKAEIQGQLRSEREARERDIAERAQRETDISAAQRTKEAATAAARRLRTDAATRRTLATDLGDARIATEATVASLRAQAAQKDTLIIQLVAEQGKLKAEKDAREGIPTRFFLPVLSQESAELFFGQAGEGMLQNITFSLAGDAGAGSLAAELVSEIAGPVRFSATTIVARAEEAEAVNANDPSSLERFFAGGGTLVLSAAMPLAFAARGNNSFVMQGHWKLAGDMAESGRVFDLEEYPANADLGFETYGLLATPLRRFQFYWFARWGFVLGSDEFYTNLGYGGQRGFGYVQWTAGLRVGSNISIVATASDGPYQMNRDPTLTFQISPTGAF